MTKFEPLPDVVPIFEGTDYARHREFEQAFERAVASAVRAGSVKRIGDSDPVQEAGAALDAFVEETEPARLLHIRSLPNRQWREMLLKHPPREDNDNDAAWGFNHAELCYDLVPASIQEGEFESDAERDEYVESLPDGYFSRVYSAAVRLNTSGGPDPKARVSSLLVRTSDESSESPARLG